MLLCAAANKCLSQLCFILQLEFEFDIGFGDVPEICYIIIINFSQL